MTELTNRRGLQIIRTHTTKRTNSTLKRHELYIKLTSLEMEKTRREVERNGLLQRLKMIDERLADVVAEQQQVKQAIAVDKHLHPPRQAESRRELKNFPYSY